MNTFGEILLFVAVLLVWVIIVVPVEKPKITTIKIRQVDVSKLK